MTSADLRRLLLLATLWGGSFLFIRVVVPVLGPIVMVELRVLLAGLVLLGAARLTRSPLEFRARWRQYLVIGALNSAVPFLLISTAELTLPASIAAILNATSPLFGAVFSAVWLSERLTARKMFGIALALCGVVLFVGWSPLVLTPTVLLAVGASLLAASFYGLSGIYVRSKMRGAPPLGIAFGSQWGASLLLAPFVPFALPAAPPSWATVGWLLVLALFSTAAAYILYFRLVVDIGATGALTVTFLTPIFGVFWGALFLREQVTLSHLLGGGIILLGAGLVTGLRWRDLRPALS